jgi:hypothetical protein
MSKKFIKTKIVLAGLLIGVSFSDLTFPFTSFVSNNTQNFSDKKFNGAKEQFNQNLLELKHYNINEAQKEVEKAQMDAHYGKNKIDTHYEQKNMPNFYQIKTHLDKIQVSLNQANIETNRYLVPNFFNQYQLPSSLSKHYNVNINGISTLATKATSEQNYLLNYYQNKHNINDALKQAHNKYTLGELKLSDLNQLFHDNVNVATELNNYLINSDVSDYSQIDWTQFKSSYDYVNKMDSASFWNNASILNDVKQNINYDNLSANLYSQFIKDLGIFLAMMGTLLLPLGIIFHLDKLILLFYRRFRYLGELRKYNKGNINYKKIQSDLNQMEVFKHDAKKLVSFMKQYKLKQTSKIGIASVGSILVGYYLIHLSLSHEMLFDPFKRLASLSLLLPGVVIMLTHLKNIDLDKRFHRAQERLNRFKKAHELIEKKQQEALDSFDDIQTHNAMDMLNEKINTKTLTQSK